jgi:hypothetical protein
MQSIPRTFPQGEDFPDMTQHNFDVGDQFGGINTDLALRGGAALA